MTGRTSKPWYARAREMTQGTTRSAARRGRVLPTMTSTFDISALHDARVRTPGRGGPGDRRALQVTLTDVGHQTAAAFHAEVSAELNRLIAPLAAPDRERFRATMTEIIARCRTSRPDHC
jgi:hypothetical protein